MNCIRREDSAESPMEVVFSWHDAHNVESAPKRRCAEDSGYFTTPCSSSAEHSLISPLDSEVSLYEHPPEVTSVNSCDPVDVLPESHEVRQLLPSPVVRVRRRIRPPRPTRFLRPPRPSLDSHAHVDILYQLGVRSNFSHLLSNIFSYLSDRDISNMTMVSKTWLDVINSMPKVRDRWLKYVAAQKETKENRHLGGRIGGSRTPLGVMNHSLETPRTHRLTTSPPVSPDKFRFHLFRKEGAKLKEGERLVQCPACTMPARCSGGAARCTRLSCQREYCCLCWSPYHAPRPCPLPFSSSDTTPQKVRPAHLSFNKPKRSLRRLLT